MQLAESVHGYPAPLRIASRKIIRSGELRMHHTSIRRRLLLGLPACLGLAATARADDAPPPSTTSTLMEEVTVTARRREENIQDTPISIAAFSAAALDARGTERADDLARIVPNLIFQQNPGAGGSASNAAVFIRGVGQSDFIPTVDP